MEGQLLHLVQLVVRLTCSADLPPMDARLGIDGARKLNLRMRGVILLGVLAANLMLSLASAPTPGLPKGKLEEMLVYIQRRMLGMVAEEDDSNELVASIRGLLEAKVIRNLLSALTRVTRLLGSELMECGVDGRVREFASWPAYATRSKSKQPSDQVCPAPLIASPRRLPAVALSPNTAAMAGRAHTLWEEGAIDMNVKWNRR